MTPEARLRALAKRLSPIQRDVIQAMRRGAKLIEDYEQSVGHRHQGSVKYLLLRGGGRKGSVERVSAATFGALYNKMLLARGTTESMGPLRSRTPWLLRAHAADGGSHG